MHRSKRWIALVASVLALWSVGFVIWWPRDDGQLGFRSLAAIVALGSDLNADSSIGAYGEQRLLKALDLLRQRAAPLLVTTRGQRPGGTTSDWAQRKLVEAANAADRWKIEPGVATSTHDEAMHLQPLVPQGARIAVVTSRLHTRRACATFEHAGYRVTCVIGYVDPWYKLPYAVARENAATLLYWLRGWAFVEH